jgi:hypothetical protein
MPVSDLRGQIRSWQGAQARKINLVSAARRSPPRIVLPATAPLRRRRFPGRVAVGLDARDSKVAVQGSNREDWSPRIQSCGLLQLGSMIGAVTS